MPPMEPPWPPPMEEERKPPEGLPPGVRVRGPRESPPSRCPPSRCPPAGRSRRADGEGREMMRTLGEAPSSCCSEACAGRGFGLASFCGAGATILAAGAAAGAGCAPASASGFGWGWAAVPACGAGVMMRAAGTFTGLASSGRLMTLAAAAGSCFAGLCAGARWGLPPSAALSRGAGFAPAPSAGAALRRWRTMTCFWSLSA